MKEKKPRPEQKNNKKINHQMSEVEHFDSVAIKVAPSVLKNKLYKFWNEKKRIFRMTAAFPVMLTVIPNLTSKNDPGSFLGMSGETLKAIYFIVFISSLGFLLFDGASLVYKWKNGNPATIEKFIDDLTDEKK